MFEIEVLPPAGNSVKRRVKINLEPWKSLPTSTPQERSSRAIIRWLAVRDIYPLIKLLKDGEADRSAQNVLAELLLEDAVGKPLPEQPDKYDRNRDIYIIGTFVMLTEELRYSGEEAFKVIKNEFGFKNINSARDRIYGRKDSPRQQQRLKVILDQLRVGMRRPLPTERSSP